MEYRLISSGEIFSAYSNITKTATSNAFGKYQDLGQRNVIPVSFISISGNTVTLDILGQVDTTSEAQWSVTAVGK